MLILSPPEVGAPNALVHETPARRASPLQAFFERFVSQTPLPNSVWAEETPVLNPGTLALDRPEDDKVYFAGKEHPRDVVAVVALDVDVLVLVLDVFPLVRSQAVLGTHPTLHATSRLLQACLAGEKPTYPRAVFVWVREHLWPHTMPMHDNAYLEHQEFSK